ncbi:A-kinase anchor protein SPHKAP [Ochotona princeps]|uniref:A-kinase anchor protein SPHKAP n=1 Tax=Ochotona princeps TaxID=9978 RepID=UPI002714C664|nr:A-kinase anchor protein SPHKAP [Ochotona princeps]
MGLKERINTSEVKTFMRGAPLKPVLRSNSLLESTDYWLHNQRTPCQIGFVEDKSEDCASVCFVNLDVNKDACSNEHLQQKLVNVSPDLPKLINSMNVQQPKENEIVLLSGLASGNLQADFEVSQCPWLPDICLVQCARGNRPNSTNCIIFEINKFLIGLELVQERQLHLETNILKLEDDTNCSLSSIEEDFLTASEHLEEESEVEENRNGYEHVNVSVNVLESKKSREVIQEEWNYREKLLYKLGDKYLSKYHTALGKSEGSLENRAENSAFHGLDPSARPPQWKGEAEGNERSATSHCYAETLKGQVEKPQAPYFPSDAYSAMMVKKHTPSAGGTTTEQGRNLDLGEYKHRRNSLPPLHDGEATTGKYATNLAESVLQDAFIRLSQAQSTLSQESALSVSAGSTLLPSACSTKDGVVPRSWNELPKIVIVQSPDGSDLAPKPGVPLGPEVEVSTDTSSIVSGEICNRHPQSALEVALACAATVVGTISSPQATEKFTMEQEALVTNHPHGGNGAPHTPTYRVLREPSLSTYSFPSALCGMTQVASAVAVCGLGEKEEAPCPGAPVGFLPTTEGSAAISSLCGSTSENRVDLGEQAIAEALLQEAAMVLTRPDAYSSIGDLIDSVNRRIRDVASKPQTLCSDSVHRNELAQTLSSVILKHCIDEFLQQNTMSPSDGRQSSEILDALMANTSQLLLDVMCLTFKRMSPIVQEGECSTLVFKEIIQQETETPGQAYTEATDSANSHPPSNLHSPCHAIHDKTGAPTLQSELSHTHRMLESLTTKTSPKKTYLQGMARDDTKAPHPMPCPTDSERRPSVAPTRALTFSKYEMDCQDAKDSISPNTQDKHNDLAPQHHGVQVNLSLSGNDVLPPDHPGQPAKNMGIYCITDFAEELSETIVSMATEIAAICLDNSNGKQPWFCAWKRGNELLVTPNVPCRSLKRRKESQGGGTTGRKHRPPRLSEIKRKTDEHPELKEKLMNRVVDESVNLEDIPDSVNTFANEVAAKIMNLTEFSVVDSMWQAQSLPRNRFLSGDRWNRLKASSCESIPEEDSEARGHVNSLGLSSTLSQPASRASSVSKQSSCESITDEFSRFMVNQMENEGRGFELLLDYYAGKNASSILTSAIQQACGKTEHLSVKPSCPSKQSSTESITEEFYRYMLRDMERESKEGSSSRRSSQDWTSGFLSPSLRSPLSYRQSSMPDSRSPCARLTVNVPVKANSLDGFAQNCTQDSLSVQPVNSVSSSGLCKSDSCLYRRGGTDHVTNMLIHDTWASSIEALMRKNKIIVDDTETGGTEQASGESLRHMEKCANRAAASRGKSGPTLLVQEPVNAPGKDLATESKHPNKTGPLTNHQSSDSPKPTHSCQVTAPPMHDMRSLCSQEVPLIQIETDQREKCVGENTLLEEADGPLDQQKTTEVARDGDAALRTGQHSSNSLNGRGVPEAEISAEARLPEEIPSPPSSSEASTGSWSQLLNEEDNPDDTSSFLQLSERSMSNGNSSATSSLGIMELDISQESMPSSAMIHELAEEKEIPKGQSENIKACDSAPPVGTSSHQRSLLVINFDLEPERPDAELRATLQWIAASELGIPTIYFKKSQESRIEKFLDVVRLVHQKSWKVGDIFQAVVQYCKVYEEQKDGAPSLFDWLLELG